MNQHATEFLRAYGRVKPFNFDGKRAESPAALIRAAAKRARFRIAQVDRHIYVISHGRKTIGGLAIPQNSLPSPLSLDASRSSPLARSYLRSAGIPVPRGFVCPSDQFQSGMVAFQEMSTPALVRPASSRRGAGITAKVSTKKDFERAWQAAVEAIHGNSADDSRIMIDEYVEGLDVRAFVVGEKVIAALVRVPHFCIGDGVRTLSELISEADAARTAHPLLGRFDYDATLPADTSERDLDAVTEDGRVYGLASAVNMRRGGVTIDATSLLSRDVKELAISASWAVPGSEAAEVDLLLPDVKSTLGAKVLDVNVEAEFTPYLYPWIGTGRDIASAIVQRMSENSQG